MWSAVLLSLIAQADLEREVDTYLETTVISAEPPGPARMDDPHTAHEITDEMLRRRAYRTLPQALRDVPGVLVQETASGQGSPFIRGFTGFHNLFLVDGIRLNNSVFRPGPNQYWNTVDSYGLERISVLKGPGGVLWGADAVGGVVLAETRAPGLGGRSGRAYYRGSTAENSHTARVEGGGGGEATAALAGLTGKHYGDLVAGDGVGTQENAGYDELDGDVKVEHLLDERTRIVGAYQHVRQYDVPRTHRTVFAVPFHGTDPGDELRRDLDQERRLLYLQIRREDAWSASLSWQRQEEARHRARTGGRIDDQGFTVDTLGLWARRERKTGFGRLTYGFDWYHDIVDSFSSSNPVQGPVADDASYDLAGVFLQNVVALSERLDLTLGARASWAAADADSVVDPETDMRTSLRDDWFSIVGSARVLYWIAPERVNVYGGVSQGFRAPNLSDLTRLDSARSAEFEVPAPGLDPEHYTTFEVGTKAETRALSVQAAVFYTDIRDQIIRFPTGDMRPDGAAIVTKDNVGDGYVWGAELGWAWRFAPRWTFFGGAAWLDGAVDTFPTSAPVVVREPIDRLMPLNAHFGLRWEQRGAWVEAQVVAAAAADRLSTRDESDTQRIPPGGTPGYGVFHLRGGYRFDRFEAGLAVENIFDKAYRVHGSGITMPGTNVIFTLSVDF